jgi:hypothetical protein
MGNIATFESAALMIAAQEGCDRITAMQRAKEQHPLLYLEFAERVKAGGPDRTADLFEAVGLKSEKSFEQVVADHYRAGGSKSEAVANAMRTAPEAYRRYLLRLKNGEHIRFDLNR